MVFVAIFASLTAYYTINMWYTHLIRWISFQIINGLWLKCRLAWKRNGFAVFLDGSATILKYALEKLTIFWPIWLMCIIPQCMSIALTLFFCRIFTSWTPPINSNLRNWFSCNWRFIVLHRYPNLMTTF